MQMNTRKEEILNFIHVTQNIVIAIHIKYNAIFYTEHMTTCFTHEKQLMKLNKLYALFSKIYTVHRCGRNWLQKNGIFPTRRKNKTTKKIGSEEGNLLPEAGYLAYVRYGVKYSV